MVRDGNSRGSTLLRKDTPSSLAAVNGCLRHGLLKAFRPAAPRRFSDRPP